MGHAPRNQPFHPFALERLLSQWEHRVDWNLSESGVCPLPLRELLTNTGTLEDLLATPLAYPQTNGLPELRDLERRASISDANNLFPTSRERQPPTATPSIRR